MIRVDSHSTAIRFRYDF